MWCRRNVACECDLQAATVKTGTSLVVAMMNDVTLPN